MTGLRFTHHAEDRLQQRGVPPFVIELLDRFGASARCQGAEKVFFDKQSRKALRRHLGGARSLRLIEPWLDTYAVLSDEGVVVTVGHRQKRINRE
jgi:hypothetical protein